MEAASVARKVGRRHPLEERAGREAAIGAAKVSTGTVRSVPRVAKDHLGDGDAEGLGSVWVVQDGGF